LCCFETYVVKHIFALELAEYAAEGISALDIQVAVAHFSIINQE